MNREDANRWARRDFGDFKILNKMSRCPPRRSTGRLVQVLFCTLYQKKKVKGDCVHGLLRVRVESLPFPSGRRSPPCPPWGCSPLRGKGHRHRGRAGRRPRPPRVARLPLPSGGVKIQPPLQLCGRQRERWEKLLCCCSPFGADELLKVVICQTLMSPDRACEN